MKSTKELKKIMEKNKPGGIGLNLPSPPVRSILDAFNIPRPVSFDLIPGGKKINLKNLLPKK